MKIKHILIMTLLLGTSTFATLTAQSEMVQLTDTTTNHIYPNNTSENNLSIKNMSINDVPTQEITMNPIASVGIDNATTNPLPITNTDTDDGTAYVKAYKTNQLNAVDLVLNGTTYTFDLPAYTTGYSVKSSSKYSRNNDIVSHVLTSTVTSDATVNDAPVHIDVTITQQSPHHLITLLHAPFQSKGVTRDDIAGLFPYNEAYDGVKQPVLYSLFKDHDRVIALKSALLASAERDNRKPSATALVAITDDLLATVTVTGNTDTAYDTVRGTAYAIATSARITTNTTSNLNQSIQNR